MAIFIFRWEEENGIELYYVQKCLHIESDAVPSLCPSVGISFCKRTAGIVLRGVHKPTDPPAFPRSSCCLAYSFWLWNLKRVHSGATGSGFPSHLLFQKKKKKERKEFGQVP